MAERLYILNLLMEALGLLFCLYGLYGQKFKWNIYTVLFLVVEPIVYEIGYLYNFTAAVNILLYCFIFFYSIIQFRDTAKNTIINYIICIVLASLLQACCFFPVALVLESKPVIGVYIVNYAFLVVSFILYKAKTLSRVSEFMRSDDRMVKVTIVLVSSIVVYALVVIKKGSSFNLPEFLIIFSSIGVTVILVFLWQKQKTENTQLVKEREMNQLYGNALNELVKTVRQNQHDYKNQLLALQGMAHVEKYIDQINNNEKYTQLLSKIEEPAISGFLYSKITEAERQGIEIQYDLLIPVIENASLVSDVIRIIGVLLDNAIEELNAREEEKKIKIFLHKEKLVEIAIGNISRIINPEESSAFFEMGMSTKGTGRGIGLSNVKKIVDRNGGTIQVYNESKDEKNWFFIKIELKG